MNRTYRRALLAFLAGLIALVASLIVCSVCASAHAADVMDPDEPDTPPPVYTVTEDERELLARLVWNEAGTCSQACREAVVSVVFNQLAAGYWGSSIAEVVTRPGSFVGGRASYLASASPDAGCYAAVDAVLQNGCTVPPGVRYFRASYGFEAVWPYYETVLVLDGVHFGRFTNPAYH